MIMWPRRDDDDDDVPFNNLTIRRPQTKQQKRPIKQKYSYTIKALMCELAAFGNNNVLIFETHKWNKSCVALGRFFITQANKCLTQWPDHIFLKANAALNPQNVTSRFSRYINLKFEETLFVLHYLRLYYCASSPLLLCRLSELPIDFKINVKPMLYLVPSFKYLNLHFEN